MGDESSSNAPMVATASLSIFSTLGVLGMCLMNHKETIMEKLRCWVSWGKDDDDIEAQRATTVQTLPTATTGAASLPIFPQITFPIVINNSSGQQRTAAVTIPSPFSEAAPSKPQLERSHSDPTPETSDHTGETVSMSPVSQATSSTTEPVVFRRVASLENQHSY